MVLAGRLDPIRVWVMKKMQFKTLRSRLTAQLITPVVLILLAAGVGGFIYARNTLLDQWNQNVSLKLQWAAQEIEMQLSGPLELMQIFAKMGATSSDAGLLEAIVHELDNLPAVIRTRFSWHSPATGNRFNGNDLAPAHKGHIKRFERGTFTRFAPPALDEAAGEQVVTIAMVLLDPEDTPVGNLKIVIKFDDLVSKITNSRWWQDAAACIADRESGEIILTSNRMQRRKKLGGTGDPLENELLGLFGQESAGTILGPGMPPERVAGFHRLETFPWVLVFFADGKTILAPIIHFRNGFIIGAVCLVVTTYLIIRLNVEQITTTIKHLSRRAVSVAKGDYEEKIAVRSNDEIGQLTTSFNAMIDGLKERDLIRDTFGQYVDPDFARDLMKRPETGRLGGRNQEVAVLMADIRGFTPMAERLSPEATIHILNRYFSVMIPLLRKHSGIIVDFIGDAVLAFFEPMDGAFSDAANRCVQCAFQMQQELNELNPQLASQNLPEIKIGIGIHSGPVVVGIIGSKTRKKYGIVGSCVNVCQRIQGQSNAGEIVVSEPVYREVASRVIKERSQFATLKGVSSPLMLHGIKPKENADAW